MTSPLSTARRSPRGTPERRVKQFVGAIPHDCPDTCSLLTTVENCVATRVQGNPDHPQTAGVLFTKVSRYTERTYHAERLLQPLKRTGPKGSGRFEPVSRADALAGIASRLTSIASRNAEAIVQYSYCSTIGQVQGEAMAGRFFNRLGASLLDRTICAAAGAEGVTKTLGAKVGMRVEFFAAARLIIIWGCNPIGSNLHFWRYAQQARRAGAKLVCIDPRRSETAEKSDEHIAQDPERIVAHVIEQTKSGSIIILHVMYPSRETSRQALPGVIDGLKARGFRFVTVSELLSLRGE